jgi:pantetheine-phosphate adenylyltransferase
VPSAPPPPADRASGGALRGAALYAGSFDPPHLGHLDIIRRAAGLVPSLIVAVASHPDKQPLLSLDERLTALRAMVAALDGGAPVRVLASVGATLHQARAAGVAVLVRGVRSCADLADEQAMAAIHLAHGLDTLILLSQPLHAQLSSRVVRRVLEAGLPTAGLVPPAVEALLATRRAPAGPAGPGAG